MFTIQGGAELAAKLKGLGKRTSKRFMKDALAEAAEPMRRKAASSAPRRPPQPDMADHINIDAVRGKGASVAIGPAPEFDYAFYQEYGTEHNAAHPFMRPAMGEAPAALSIMSAALWRELAGKGVQRGASDAPSMPSAPGGSGLL